MIDVSFDYETLDGETVEIQASGTVDGPDRSVGYDRPYIDYVEYEAFDENGDTVKLDYADDRRVYELATEKLNELLD